MLKYKYIPPHQRNGSLQVTPEPSPRMSRTLNPRQMSSLCAAASHTDIYGSNISLSSSRGNYLHGSMNSLASTSTPSRRKKGKAPAIPPTPSGGSTPLKSTTSSPSQSTKSTPLFKKKRQAPIPPSAIVASDAAPINPIVTKPSINESISTLYVTVESQLDESIASLPNTMADDSSSALGSSLSSAQIASECASSVSAIMHDDVSLNASFVSSADDSSTKITGPHDSHPQQQRKLIPLEASLLEDNDVFAPDGSLRNGEDTIYRRKIVPQHIPESSLLRDNEIVICSDFPTERQCEKLKENKESQNKNRQSQGLLTPQSQTPMDMVDSTVYGSNKSSYGKWKRRKGPAPGLPVPPRKVLQMLPLQDIRHELEVIEVQQQGLEKQVKLTNSERNFSNDIIIFEFFSPNF